MKTARGRAERGGGRGERGEGGRHRRGGHFAARGAGRELRCRVMEIFAGDWMRLRATNSEEKRLRGPSDGGATPGMGSPVQ